MDIFSKHKIYPIFYNFKWSTTYEILNHCVVHLKLIYYCKSSMLQLKKKKKTTRASHSMAQTELQMGLQLPWCICFLPNPQERSRSSALYPAVMSFFLPLLLSTMIRGDRDPLESPCHSCAASRVTLTGRMMTKDGSPQPNSLAVFFLLLL